MKLWKLLFVLAGLLVAQPQNVAESQKSTIQSSNKQGHSVQQKTIDSQIEELETQVQQLQDKISELKMIQKAIDVEQDTRKRYGIFIGGGFGGLRIQDRGADEYFSLIPFVLRLGYQHYFSAIGIRAYIESINGAESRDTRENISNVSYLNLHTANIDIMLDAHFTKFSLGIFGGLSQMWAFYKNEYRYDEDINSLTYMGGNRKYYDSLLAYNVGTAFTWRKIHRIEANYKIIPQQVNDIRLGNTLLLVYHYIF